MGWRSRSLGTYAWRRKFRKHNLNPRKPVDTLVQHITVTHDDGTSVRNFKADMRELERIGNDRFGSGVSYNVAIDMVTGQAGLGQALDAAGTHTLNDKGLRGFSSNQNYVAFAFSYIGMPGDKLSPAAKKTAARLIAALILLGYLNEGFDYMPHSDFAWKECPTQEVRDAMTEIYRMANAIVDRERNRRR